MPGIPIINLICEREVSSYIFKIVRQAPSISPSRKRKCMNHKLQAQYPPHEEPLLAKITPCRVISDTYGELV
jgi:hypothetical protein